MLNEFKDILKKEGLTGKEFCKRTGINYNTYRSAMRKSNERTPKFVISAIEMYYLGIGRGIKTANKEVK